MAVADSVLTVDESGNVRAVPRSSLTEAVAKRPYVRLKGNVIAATNGANVTVANLSPQLVNDIAYTGSNRQIRIMEEGIYFYAVTVLCPGQPGAPGGVFDYCHAITVNATGIDINCARTNRGEGTGSTNTGICRFAVNDIVRVSLSTASGWAGAGNYSFSIALYKLSD
ncbi:hypothetical protein [Dyadobacter luteus]|uniref:hypothetical protein n=1 Tax=Dyadobacter luteus TaxID=2259619 RepID=UPI0011C06DA5|nr:hypothetical protein [Dyadobacter luteus]